jgi:hypothetical protein
MVLATTRRLLGVCAATVFLIGTMPRAALAQAPAPSAPPPAATAEPAPAAATDAAPTAADPSTTQAPAAAAPAAAPETAAVAAPASSGQAACLIGNQEGIAPGDARTGAALMCDALRQAGASVSATPVMQPGPDDRSAYRIDLRPLGQLIILQVSYESPIGTRTDSRSLRLNGIEELVVAAPRVAESLVHGTPISSTAKVDTLVGQETRSYAKAYGETLFGIGIMGYSLPDDTWAGYGVVARLYYEAIRYSVGAEVRLGTSAEADGDSSFASIGLGARYFFNEADISPFIGGGASIMWLSAYRKFSDQPSVPNNSLNGFNYDYGGRTSIDGSGLAPFAEVGVEFLRLHDSRLDAALRLDAPTFKLHGDNHARYTMPISLLVTYSFD